MFRTISRLVPQKMTRTDDLLFAQDDLPFVQADFANVQDDLLFGSTKDDARR